MVWIRHVGDIISSLICLRYSNLTASPYCLWSLCRCMIQHKWLSLLQAKFSGSSICFNSVAPDILFASYFLRSHWQLYFNFSEQSQQCSTYVTVNIVNRKYLITSGVELIFLLECWAAGLFHNLVKGHNFFNNFSYSVRLGFFGSEYRYSFRLEKLRHVKKKFWKTKSKHKKIQSTE